MSMPPTTPPMATSFVAAQGLEVERCIPIAGDASGRKYYRLICSDARSVILAFSPAAETMVDFADKAQMLRRVGFSAPKVEALSLADRLMILEDLGQQGFGHLIDQQLGAVDSLYELAVDVVIALQHRLAAGFDLKNPLYSAAGMIDQAMLFIDGYMSDRESDPSTLKRMEQEIRLACSQLMELADSLPMTIILRDYHPDNLIYLPERQGLAACGLLDFQDAGLGSPFYDLVSLLEDARREVPTELKGRIMARYMSANPAIAPEHGARVFEVWAVIRHIRVIALFTKLGRQSGREHYLTHLPRVWRMLSHHLRSPGLEPLAEWFTRYLPGQVEQRNWA